MYVNTPTGKATITRNCYLSLAISSLLSAASPMNLAQAADVIPAKLMDAIPAGHVPYRKLHVSDGYGTQNYVCVQKADGSFAWIFISPQATLFKTDNQKATHFLSKNGDTSSTDINKLQPTWQDSNDSSKIWGAVVTFTDGTQATEVVDPTAIPWLTLRVSGALAGPKGGKTVTKTTYIQRINTVGGLAPDTSTCDSAHIGSRSLSPYQTDYLFYKADD